MKVKCTILVVSCALTLSCSSSSPTSQPPSSQPATPPTSSEPAATVTPAPGTVGTKAGEKIDSCKVLTSDDLKSVMGESLKEAKASDTAGGGFNVSQCFYSLPTFTRSVSVSITTAGTRDPREFWEETFHRAEEAEEEREREKEKAKTGKGEKERPKEGKGRSEEEEEESKPEKVTGIGDEAFWAGSPIGGALYVLKKNTFFRISIGGSDDQKTRLNKSKALAAKILSRV